MRLVLEKTRHLLLLDVDQPRPSRRGAGVLGAEQIPVGQRRDRLHESLKYGPYISQVYNSDTILYLDIPGRYKYIIILRRYKSTATSQ